MLKLIGVWEFGVNSELFKTTVLGPITDIINEAGGTAYRLEDKEALSMMALTGCFNGNFYTDPFIQLKEILEVVSRVDSIFIAKLAVYTRTHGYMKDMPAFLLAVLADRSGKDKTNESQELFKETFDKVIDNSKMLRNFVQVIRSGVVGRKSFGTMIKRKMNN